MVAARLLLAGFAAFLVLLLSAAHAAPGTEALIAEAGAALDAGKAAEAQRLANLGLSEKEASPFERGRLLLDRGLAQELLGAHQEAMADLTAAIETHALPPDERAQVLLQRGYLLDVQDRLDDAAKDYSAAITLKTPLLATALNNRANIYRRQNRFAQARRDYQAALAAGTPKPQYPYYGLGQIAEAEQDKGAARGFYAKALIADGGYQLAADRLAKLGGPPEAALVAPDVVKLRPPKDKSGGQPANQSVGLHPTPASSDRIVLRPPPRRRAVSARPGLRPALDGAPAASSEPQVQLGAWRSEPEAQDGWDKAKIKAGGGLDGQVAHILRAEIPGKGTYFRLRLTTANPISLCIRLRKAGLDCVQARD
jgi:tetratricopeptide (TPR) repeat protein